MSLSIKYKNIVVSLLICSGIFFWDIEYNYFKLETLIIILILNSFINYNFLEDLKKVKIFYILFLQTLLLDLINQEQLFFEIYIKLIYVLILELIIIRNLSFISKNLHKIIFVFFIIFLSYTFLFLYVPSQNCLGCFSIYRKFYTENSHLGMIAPSIIIFGFFYLVNKKKLIFGFLYLLFIFVVLNNFSATLFVGLIMSIFFISFVFFKNYKTQILLGYFVLFFLTMSLILMSDFKDSLQKKILNFKIEDHQQIQKKFKEHEPDNNFLNQNKYNLSKYNLGLSLEVYLKSVITSYEIFKNNFFGVGFDKYKFNTKNEIFNFKHNLTKKLNNQDSSQNFSKGISEFGILFIYIFYLIFIFTKSKIVPAQIKNFFIPILIIQIFIRGAGYFNGGFLFSFLFIFHYYYRIKNIK